MANSSIEIKGQQRDWLIKGFIYLGLMIMSLAFAFIPLLIGGMGSANIIFYALGGISFAAFTALFVLLLYKVCNPGVALILSARGFIDKKNVGEKILIEWTNVSSIKQLGKKGYLYLGISLENTDIVIAKMKSREAEEMRENLNDNLPAILISQSEIQMPIKDLKDLFTKFAREARVFTQNTNTENSNIKHNIEENAPLENTVITSEENNNQTTVEQLFDETNSTESSEVSVVEIETATPEVTSTDNEVQTIANNFYEELLKQAETESTSENPISIENKQTQLSNQTEDTSPLMPNNNISENQEENIKPEEDTIVISQEFTDILNSARSTKIAELDKILNDNLKIPTDLSENKTSDGTSDNFDFKIENTPTKSEIKISDLESMIENALSNAESSEKTEKQDDDISKIIIDIPNEQEIVNKPSKKPSSTKKKKTLVLNEKK